MAPAARAVVEGRAKEAQAAILGARTAVAQRKMQAKAGSVKQGSAEQGSVEQGSVEQRERAAPLER